MKPWQKYYIKNKERQVISHSSPELTVAYSNALPEGVQKYLITKYLLI